MQKPLLGKKIAVLVANGFSEKDLTLTQRELLSAGANIRIIAMDHGLVNSWNEEGWGLNFAADQVLSAALAVDFSMLIVPGGQRSADKLKLTEHTRRFINGFINAGKPVALFEEAVSLLAFAQKAEGRTIAAPESARGELESAGATLVDDGFTMIENIMTGKSDEEKRENYAKAVVEFLIKSVQDNTGIDAAVAA